MSSTSFEDFQKQKEIPNLDGLRAISILMVILHHSPPIQFPLLDVFQENGRFGVHFFFVISGFLITTLFIREKRTNGKVNLYNFYVRRSLRLFPLYYLMLGFTAFTVYVLNLYSPENQAIFGDKLLSYIFYYSNFLPTATQGPFFYAWSLAAEEQFYLFFGLLFAFAKPRTVIFVVTGLLIIKLFAMLFLIGTTDNLTIRNFFNYQPSILMGVILAYMIDSPKIYALISKCFCNGPMLCLVGSILLGFSAFVIISDLQPLIYYLYFFFLTLFVGIVSLVSPLPLLSWSFISYIGKISYGMYLLHMLSIMALKKISLNPFFIFSVGTVLTILFASISYTYFETPFLKLKKRFEIKRK